MKRNVRVSKKRSVIVVHTMHVGGLLLLVFATTIIHLLASSNCTELSKAIGEKERLILALKKECDMERSRWEDMNTPERLEAALLKHGLSMHYPKADQIVRLRANGTPYPGQLSVAKNQRRTTETVTARVARRKR